MTRASAQYDIMEDMTLHYDQQPFKESFIANS